jgi:hypothetical protein
LKLFLNYGNEYVVGHGAPDLCLDRETSPSKSGTARTSRRHSDLQFEKISPCHELHDPSKQGLADIHRNPQ